MADDQTNNSENLENLNAAISGILDYFFNSADSNEVLINNAFKVLGQANNEQVLNMLEANGERITQHIINGQLEINGAYAWRFVDNFIKLLDAEKKHIDLTSMAQYMLRQIPHKSFNIALVLIFNSESINENYKDELKSLGVEVLRNFGRMWSFEKVIEQRRKEKIGLGYEFLFSGDILPQIDLSRNLRVNKVTLKGDRRSSKSLLDKYGIQEGQYDTTYVYIPYWELKGFDLNDLITNIDSIPMNVLANHQSRRIVIQKNFFPSNKDLMQEALSLSAVGYNKDFLTIEQDPSNVSPQDLRIYEFGSGDTAVNMALALKVVKESIKSNVSIPELLDILLEDEDLDLNIELLNKAINELIYIIDDSEAIDKALYGIESSTLFEKLTDFAVFSSIARNLEYTGSNTDGQQILSPFAISRHISTSPLNPEIPPIEFLPFMVSSYMQIYTAYPQVLVAIEQQSKEEIAREELLMEEVRRSGAPEEQHQEILKSRKRIKKLKETSSSFFFDISKMVKEAVLLNQRVEEILIIDIKNFLGQPPYIPQSENERKQILEEVLERLQSENIGKYNEVQAVMNDINDKLKSLESLLIFLSKTPQLLNRRQPQKPSRGEPYDITAQMRQWGGSFPLSRRIKAKHNIAELGDEF